MWVESSVSDPLPLSLQISLFHSLWNFSYSDLWSVWLPGRCCTILRISSHLYSQGLLRLFDIFCVMLNSWLIWLVDNFLFVADFYFCSILNMFLCGWWIFDCFWELVGSEVEVGFPGFVPWHSQICWWNNWYLYDTSWFRK